MIVKKVEPLNAGDTIGKAISKMQETKLDGLPVFSDKYEGMVYLRDLVVRELDINTKVNHFIKDTPKFSEENFKEYNTLPYFEEGNFTGIIRLSDYLPSLNVDFDLHQVAIEQAVINQNETLGRARNLLNEEEIILVKEEGSIIGYIDLFSLAKHVVPKRDRIFSPDKLPEKEIGVRDFVESFVSVEEGITREELFELLRKKGFVVFNNKIVTPKTIFRSAGIVEEAIKVDFVGFDLSEGIYTDVIYNDLNKFAEKVQKLIKPIEIKYHLRKLRKTGKPLYEIDGRIVAGGKVLEAKITGYGLMDLVQNLIDKLERQVMKLRR